MFRRIEQLKAKLNQYRPLTGEEVRRLRDEYLIDFTILDIANNTRGLGNESTL